MEDSNQQVYVGGGSASSFFSGIFKLSKTTYIYAAVVIIALIVLSSGAYLLASAGSKPKSTVSKSSDYSVVPTLSISNESAYDYSTIYPTLEPTEIPIPANASDGLLVNWNVYVSSSYGYSIKYPDTWTVKNQTQQDPKTIEYLVFNPKNAKVGSLSATLSYSNRTYKEAAAIGASQSEDIVVASVSGVKKLEQDSNKNITIHVVIPFGNGSVIFYAKNQYADIFNQMLSTFSFL